MPDQLASNEPIRSRDCIILVKGDAYPVTIDQTLATQGWKGGQAVQWVASSLDEFLVTQSNGYYAGFMLWGSSESSDQYTAMTENQPYYRFGTVGAGGWHILTTSFEKYTFQSRKSGGPLVPLVYHASDRLVFSIRGYWTKEITEWVDSGIPDLVARGLNEYYIGFVTQAPTALTNFYLGVQVSI
jgi:hypothetical protein